ncbi:MAG: tRNA (adenosine(37)-N6)-threonylcarbamoyltransferase complex ATPase subunit type 1 TsaE [Pseudomonadota bacterium]
MIVSLPDMQATAGFGAALAPLLGAGDTVLLEGPLGAGKTALARAIIQARLAADGAKDGSTDGASEEVPSPSFTLVQVYGAAPEIWHCDLYRLHSAQEVEELGLADAFDRALVLIEWPDRLGPLQPQRHIRVALADAPVPPTPAPIGFEEPGRLAQLTASGSGWEALLDRAAAWRAE